VVAQYRKQGRIDTSKFVIDQAYYLGTPVKKVFQALTDSKMLVKWFLSKARVVPKKGGVTLSIGSGGIT